MKKPSGSCARLLEKDDQRRGREREDSQDWMASERRTGQLQFRLVGGAVAKAEEEANILLVLCSALVV